MYSAAEVVSFLRCSMGNGGDELLVLVLELSADGKLLVIIMVSMASHTSWEIHFGRRLWCARFEMGEECAAFRENVEL